MGAWSSTAQPRLPGLSVRSRCPGTTRRSWSESSSTRPADNRLRGCAVCALAAYWAILVRLHRLLAAEVCGSLLGRVGDFVRRARRLLLLLRRLLHVLVDAVARQRTAGFRLVHGRLTPSVKWAGQACHQSLLDAVLPLSARLCRPVSR